MNRKGEFNLQTFLVTLLLFIGIVVTFASTARKMALDYQPVVTSNVSADFQNTYNKLDAIETTTSDIQDKVVATDTGSTDAATEFFGDALNTLKLIGTSLSTTTTLMTEMAATLGVNAFWFRILQAVLLISIFMLIVYMIFRYKG